MDDSIKFQRFAAITALVAIPLAIGQAVTSLMAVNYDRGLWSHPNAIIAIGAAQAQILRWSMILDVFGDYLLLIPLMLFLGSWLKPRSPNFVTFYTLCGLAYPGGCVAALDLAIRASCRQPARNLANHLRLFYERCLSWAVESVRSFVLRGLVRGHRMAAAQRAPHPGHGHFVIGLFTLLDPLGKILQVDTIFLIGVGGMALLVSIWLVWIGIDLVRQPVQSIS